MKSFVRISTVLLLQISFMQAQPDHTWQRTNGPGGGTIHSLIEVQPTNLFAGTSRGFYRSRDGGGLWEPVLDDFLSDAVRAFAVKTDGDIFAGSLRTVFHTADDGKNWSARNLGLPGDYVFAMATTDSGYIFAGTFDSGVFRSSDNGVTWVQVNNGLTNDRVLSLLANEKGQLFAGTFSSGIFRSDDNGETWTAANSDLSGNISAGRGYALALNSRQHLFAGTSLGLFRSEDSGETWTQIDSGFAIKVGSNAVLSIAINPQDHVFAGTYNGVFRSTDNGETWSPLTDAFMLPDNYIMSIFSLLATENGDIFAGTDRYGLFLSKDNGNTWRKAEAGLGNTFVNDIVINEKGNVFAATHAGVFFSNDRGEIWSTYPDSLANGFTRGLTLDNEGHLLAAGERGLFRFNPKKNTWTRLLEHAVNTAKVSPEGVIFAGSGSCSASVYRSIDDGNTWEVVSNGINLEVSCGQTFTLEMAPDGAIWLGTNDGLFRSADNGDLWVGRNDGIKHSSIHAITFNAAGDVFIGTHDGVFLSTDNGEIWTELNPRVDQITALLFDQAGRLYAGSKEKGIFVSEDDGRNWAFFTSGLSNNKVHALAIAPEGLLYAGTDGSGIFRTATDVTSVEDEPVPLPETFSLSQNYPNPFNPTTKISYSISQAGNVELKIFNLKGQELWTLVRKFQQSGFYSFDFDAGNLASGIYIYRLSVGGSFNQSKKMLLIR